MLQEPPETLGVLVGGLETTCVGVSGGCVLLVYFEYLGVKCRTLASTWSVCLRDRNARGKLGASWSHPSRRPRRKGIVP